MRDLNRATFYIELGKRLSKARLANVLTRQTLADLCTCTPSEICNWESGVGHPSAHQLLLVAECLHVSVSYLVGEASPGAVAPPESCEAQTTNPKSKTRFIGRRKHAGQ